MAYTSQYTQGDLSTMIMDLIGTVFAVMIENVGLLILLVILGVIVYLCRGLIGSLFGMIRFK
jgi:hypothetical protein